MFIWRTAETYRPHAIQLKEAFFVNMPYSTIRSYRKALEELLDYLKEREQIWLGQITFELLTADTVASLIEY